MSESSSAPPPTPPTSATAEFTQPSSAKNTEDCASSQVKARGGSAAASRRPSSGNRRRTRWRARTPPPLVQTQSRPSRNDNNDPPSVAQIHGLPCSPDVSERPSFAQPQATASSSISYAPHLNVSRPEPSKKPSIDDQSARFGTKEKNEDMDTDDAVTLLERLSIFDGRGEIELPVELALANVQRQEDEFVALEAIFGDNVTIFAKKDDGSRSLQINTSCEILDSINVIVELGESKPDGLENSNAEKFVYNFKVQYLPPIMLTCLLPVSYPSHQAPYFVLDAKWLDQSMLSRLCSQLDMIWAEQTGQEVLFQWAQWLQSSSLTHLGFEDGITIRDCDTRDAVDVRAISQKISGETVVPFMISYSNSMALEAFLNTSHVCTICYNEFAGTEFIRLPCQHFFCLKCSETYCKMHVKDGTVNQLICPAAKCSIAILPDVLKTLLSGEDFERWESLLLERTLDSMADVVYCPRCKTACLDDGDNHSQCSKCFYSFCTLCYDTRHIGKVCMSPEQKILYLKRRQESGMSAKSHMQKVMDDMNAALSLKEALRISKQCPNCGMAIFRSEGCNKMTCSYCGGYFCYKCGKSITGYDHFREEDNECELFAQEEIDRWNRQMLGHQGVVARRERGQQANAEGELFPQHPCPVCRQQNFKVDNNNHLRCESCGCHYCALCRKRVRKATEHFGPKGCKQHTVDIIPPP